MRKMVLSLLVENTFGVLSRVSGLFSRRGYSIDSITAGPTENTEYSRMTVVATGDEQILDQIKKQLAKLEDVKEIKELEHVIKIATENNIYHRFLIFPHSRDRFYDRNKTRSLGTFLFYCRQICTRVFHRRA